MTSFKKRLPLLLLTVLALTACFTIGSMFLVDGTASASPAYTNTVTVAHISDVHYFPLDYCYVYTVDENGDNIEYVDRTTDLYSKTDFMRTSRGDTKLIAESGAILSSIIQSIIDLAEDLVEQYNPEDIATVVALDAVPDYILVSGDNSKNAERLGLVEVANAFRYLQNRMRAISFVLDESTTIYPFEAFQVFIVPGNHDLYNSDALIYDNIRDNGIDDGSAVFTDTVDTKLWAMIFAGLGYPDVDSRIYNDVLRKQVKFGARPEPDDTGLSAEEFWFGNLTGEYVFSTNASNLNLYYYDEALQDIYELDYDDYDELPEGDALYADALLTLYNQISEGYNALSFVAEILESYYISNGYTIVMCDSTDRVATDRVVPVLANAKQIQARQDLYTYDYETESFTALNTIETVFAALDAGEAIYYNTGYEHETGGKITEDFLNWLETLLDTGTIREGEYNGMEETIIFSSHHNLVPHFDTQDEILKDFTAYNWEYVTKRLLKMGVRYSFTGHQHSSDIVSYTDAAGRVMYDFETGSVVSYTAPVRYVNFTRKVVLGVDNIVAENAVSRLDELSDKSLAEVQSSNIVHNPEQTWNDIDVSGISGDNDEETIQLILEARLAANPDFVLYALMYDELSTYTFNEHIGNVIYNNLVGRLMDNFISKDIINTLIGTLEGFFNGSFRTMLGGAFADYSDVTFKLVQSMIDQILNGMTYHYDGTDFSGTPDNPALIQMVRAILDDILDLEFGAEGQKLSLRNLTVEILKTFTTGSEFTHINEILNATAPAADNDTPAANRARFAVAMRQIILEAENGILIRQLFDALLDPLLLSDTSIIKTLFNFEFNFTGVLTPEEETTANSLFDVAVDAINNLFVQEGETPLSPDIVSLEKFCLGDILNSAKSVLDSVLGNAVGIHIGDKTIIEFAEDFLSKYMVESFYTGTGGIIKNIFIAFVVDDTKDIADMSDPSMPLNIRYSYKAAEDANYASINGVTYTYVQGQLVSDEFNPATTENGRLPSKLAANFDIANPQTKFAFSYYTEDDIFTRFEILDQNGAVVLTVETNASDAIVYDTTYTEPSAIGWETRSDSATWGSVTANLKTTTMPAYVPLIDLGLLCLTHTEVTYEVGDNEYYYSAGMRDGFLDNPELHISNYVNYKNRHTIIISGLTAGTTYRYRVYGTYDDGTPQGKSFALHSSLGINNFTMTTAPSADTQRFSFLAISDLQASIIEDYELSASVMQKIAETEGLNDYAFILNGGDMTDNGKNFAQWGWALDSSAAQFASTSMLFTAGNHEDGSFAATKFFNYSLPTGISGQNDEGGLYYSLDYGILHIIVLNTNDTDKNGLGKTQLDWLKADLEANDAKWTIVLMHKGLYTAGSHSYDAEVVAMRSQLTPLFAEYGVDLVLAGHDHTYTVTQIIDKNGNLINPVVDKDGYIASADAGVIYMTLGSLGEKFYNFGENPDVNPKFDNDNSILETLRRPTFAYFTVDGDNLIISGYEYDFETEEFGKATDIKLTQKLGKVGTAVSNATINGKSFTFGKPVTGGYFSYNFEFDIDMSQFADGSEIVFFSGGKQIDGLNLAPHEGKKFVDVFLKDADGNLVLLGTVELVRDGFALYTSLFAVGAFLIAAGVAVGLFFFIRSKKLALKLNDGGDAPTGGDDGAKDEGKDEIQAKAAQDVKDSVKEDAVKEEIKEQTEKAQPQEVKAPLDEVTTDVDKETEAKPAKKAPAKKTSDAAQPSKAQAAEKKPAAAKPKTDAAEKPAKPQTAAPKAKSASASQKPAAPKADAAEKKPAAKPKADATKSKADAPAKKPAAAKPKAEKPKE